MVFVFFVSSHLNVALRFLGLLERGGGYAIILKT